MTDWTTVVGYHRQTYMELQMCMLTISDFFMIAGFIIPYHYLTKANQTQWPCRRQSESSVEKSGNCSPRLEKSQKNLHCRMKCELKLSSPLNLRGTNTDKKWILS